MKKWIGFLFLLISVLSCNHPEKKSGFVPNPTTLEELFRGFNNNELSPDTVNLDKEPIVVVATGHLYPLLKFPLVYNALINEVKKQKPDYFFALGDLVFNNTDAEWDTVFSYLNKLNTRVYFSPGNHDLNYHYERYYGKRDHEIEAEMRYLNKVGYRYKLVKDNLANYVFINANDSVNRILSYIKQMRPKFDPNKQMILLSSQSLWYNQQQDPKNPNSWVNRPFRREKLLPYVEDFNYLIHGDWNPKYFRGKFRKNKGYFNVIAVGNKKVGDSLFVTRLLIYRDSIISKPFYVNVPEESHWYK